MSAARAGGAKAAVQASKLGKRAAVIERMATLGGVSLCDPTELTGDIEALANELLAPEARLARPELALAPAEDALLAAASDIGVAGAAAAELRADTKQASERRSDAASQREEARQQLLKVLARAPGDAELERVRGISLAALSAACAKWASETERHARTAPPYLPPYRLPRMPPTTPSASQCASRAL